MEKQNKQEKTEENKLIVIIRISGMINVRDKVDETLDRLKLRRKYACTLLKPTKDNLGMIEKVKYYVSFGNIDKETLVELIKARAQKIDKKSFKAEEAAEELISGKSLNELGFKPFFRLHPPRGGIKSREQCTKGGVLGYNKEINKLVKRML